MERNLFKKFEFTNKKDQSEWHNTNLRIRGKPVMGKTIQGKYKYEDIRPYIQKISNALAKKGIKAEIQTAIHFRDSDQWRGSSFRDLGEPIDLFDPSDSDVNHGKIVNAIQIYLVKK